MESSDVIAERELIFVSPEGTEISTSLRFGRPYESDEHGYCCEFAIPEVIRPRFGAGVDGIQAILLSMLMAASHIDVLQSNGWKVLWPDTRDETSSREIFEAEQFVKLKDDT